MQVRKATIQLLYAVFLMFSAAIQLSGQNLKNDFKAVNDSLKVLLKERNSVETKLKMETVTKRGSDIDFHFSADLSDYPWTDEDVKWFRQEISRLMPDAYAKYSVGNLFAKKVNLNTLITPGLSHDGNPSEYKYKGADPRGKVRAMVARIGEERYTKGLTGRYIALWQSHGRYYEESTDRWEWQRAPTHRTVEDMYTQSYVLPFLIPMLENAGAYVLTPRERDIQRNEVIIDNDPAFSGTREGLLRRSGTYSERGEWSSAGTGFADAKKVYTLNENPFQMGTVRKTAAVTEEVGQKAEAVWSFEVPESGEYAVYISYKTLPNSCEAAHYTITHSNGRAEFLVNQKLGGGTWVYVGHFHFEQGAKSSVKLDNISSTDQKGRIITADGVKIGGGMGKIARGPQGTAISKYTTSGVPAYMEGALYWEQFAGVDTTITRNWEGDYTQDFASRGAWVSQLTGGSYVNPDYKGEGKNIPVDLSLGFHSDAGVTPNDSIIGTLSIYTLSADGSEKLPDGRSRQLGRHLAGIVQDQVVADLREDFDPQWSRRMLWNKSYSESRTTSVPGMLLELLSHQNFADMKYGLDPAFRFTTSRAVYKGMLKFLSNAYGTPYAVQPLPVNSISASFTADGEVKIRWKETEDKKEPTAKPKSFILHTRIGDGEFNEGVKLDLFRKEGDFWYTTVKIDPDELYSFRIVAENEGGKSFPSETVCVGINNSAKATVMVVNNFDRVAAPTWVDTPVYAGFDGRIDAGVPYIQDISFIGENYEFRRDKKWVDDDEAGFGASFTDKAGTIIPGNTFDFIKIHGMALMQAGYSFCSASRDAYIASGDEGCKVIDIICGKQVTTKIGAGNVPDRFEVFPAALQTAIKTSTAAGRHIIISGEYIATDAWDEVYPIEVNTEKRAKVQKFIKETLGYEWVTNHGCSTGMAAPSGAKSVSFSGMEAFGIHQELNSDIYCVETPDGIKPYNNKGEIILRYTNNNIPAAVAFNNGGYKVLSFGFPLETIKETESLKQIIRCCMDYLK